MMPTLINRDGPRHRAPLTLRGPWGELTVPGSESWTRCQREDYYARAVAEAGVALQPGETPAMAVMRLSLVPVLGWVPDEPVGERLKRLQSKLGISTNDLAARLGIAQPLASAMRARPEAKLSTIHRICAALDVPLACFAGARGGAIERRRRGRAGD